MIPYTEKIQDYFIVRKFSQDIDPTDLLWHRDLKNREVNVIEGKGWKIQLDNQLPCESNSIFIPKMIWHRVIKGDGDLIVHIKEWD